MGPIDYSTQVQTPFAAAAQGYQLGAAVRNDQFAQQQQQQALAQQQQMQRALATVAMDPNSTGQDYGRLMTAYPALAEPLAKAWSAKNDTQQQNTVSSLIGKAAALKNGNPQVAADAFNQQADAMENTAGGPTPQSQHLRDLASHAIDNPQSTLSQIYLQLAAIPAGQKALAALDARSVTDRAEAQAPADLAKKNADAAVAVAGVPANSAKPAIDNAKTQNDIKIADLNTQIAQANSETERGRLTLERDKLVQEQAQTANTRSQAAQDSLDGATQALQTLQQIKQHPGMDGFFTAPGTKWGAIWGKVPGTDRQALNNWVDSLKGQLGFTSLMKAKAASPVGASGFGALSEGELKLLSGLAANLDPNSADFPAQLASVERFLQKSEATTVSRPNLPTAAGGGAFVMKSPRYGNVTENDVNRLMAQHPGSTRDEILRFLSAKPEAPQIPN